MTGTTGRLLLVKAGVRLRRPLHGSASANPLRKVEVVSHAELVAVTNDRRSG